MTEKKNGTIRRAMERSGRAQVVSLALVSLMACEDAERSPDPTHDASEGDSGMAGSSNGGAAGWGGSFGSAGGETFDAANCAPARDAGGSATDFDASAPPGTFFCWTNWNTQQNLYCLADSEYCAVASFNGSTVAGPVCRPLNGCSTCECMKADALNCVFNQGSSISCRQFADMRCLDATTAPAATGPTVFCSTP